MARTSKSILLALTGLAAVALVFAAGRVDPNNPTGSHGLIVIDKIGRHVRFFDPSTYQEISNLDVGVAVSYTHLDVYKRQGSDCPRSRRNGIL